MKVGDLVRLRKSHPAVKRWRRAARAGLTIRQWAPGSRIVRWGSTMVQWAEAGSPRLLLEKCDYSDERWEVLGPGGELASFDEYLFTKSGMS